MIGVGKNREWEFQFIREFPTLVLIVDADGYDVGACSGELGVIFGQTGQLLSAIRSPVTSIEHQHYFGLADEIFQRDARSPG